MELYLNPEDPRRSLFNRIVDFPLDDGRLGAFSSRLRRDQGWSPHFTQRAIEEYRKFLWIAATSGQEVTPSKVVDEVWHLHILHTRSYFDDLCCDALGRVLHHNPGDGSPADARFTHQYTATLALYQTAFGSPPVDIWPRPETVERRKTSLSRFWLAYGPAALFATPVYAATTTSGETKILTLIGFIVSGILLDRLICAVSRNGPHNRSKSSNESGCSSSGTSGGDTGCHDGGGSDGGSCCGSSCGAGCGS